jgi:rod shape-determining protein MreC
VRNGQPVINEDALIGRVSDVFGGAAQVTLLTDTTSKVSVRVGKGATFGIVEPSSAGNPADLVVKFAPAGAPLNVGDRVVTRGTVSDSGLQSLYPPDLPIGKVTRIDNEGTDTQEIHVKPDADVRSLDFVQILTRPQGRKAP